MSKVPFNNWDTDDIYRSHWRHRTKRIKLWLSKGRSRLGESKLLGLTNRETRWGLNWKKNMRSYWRCEIYRNLHDRASVFIEEVQLSWSWIDNIRIGRAQRITSGTIQRILDFTLQTDNFLARLVSLPFDSVFVQTRDTRETTIWPFTCIHIIEVSRHVEEFTLAQSDNALQFALHQTIAVHVIAMIFLW